MKEAHETLYHFHEPQNETEANAWLFNYLLRYNDQPHRSASHSRMEDWLHQLPPEGLREMCSWERFCTFAREPERRQVGNDAQVSVAGVRYDVDPDLAGETVLVWFGLYDDQLYVEHGERRYGPYAPSGGPIPLHRYRRFKKTRTQQRADRIEGARRLVESQYRQLVRQLRAGCGDRGRIFRRPDGANLPRGFAERDGGRFGLQAQSPRPERATT